MSCCCQLKPTADHRTLHGHNKGNATALNAIKDPVPAARAFDGTDQRFFHMLGEVQPCAKMRSAAPDHGSHRLALRALHRDVQCLDHAVRNSVALGGAVQADARDAVRQLVCDRHVISG